MRNVLGHHRLLRLSRVSLVVLSASAAAGCSGDISRFAASGGSGGQTPLPPRDIASAAPAAQPEYTGAIAAVPQPRVERQALAAPAAPSGFPAPVASAPAQTPALSNRAPQTPAPQITWSANGWTAQGGATVVAAPGDNVDMLSRRFGVPPAAIRGANGLGVNGQISPGQRVTIPVYNLASTSPTPAPMTPRKDVPQGPGRKVAQGGIHVVAPGESLISIAKLYGVSAGEIKAANHLKGNAVRSGQRLSVPGALAAAKPVQQRTQAAALPPMPKGRPVPPAPVTQAKLTPAEPARPTASRIEKVASEPVRAADKPRNDQQAMTTPASYAPSKAQEEALPEPGKLAASSFRWPVRGRIIGKFGDKGSGEKNDGINLAVPEGTPIKAAENGVVVYAGNELKGYGNLVLVRHDGDWVTAYAHASAVNVKRGDKVTRGQIIARAGQTGNVSSPQVHFEVRKGSKPVDPMQHLAGGGD